ncbi:MAG: hypothetical protein RLZZ234_381 [Candidatus Parcubacteria bacterium]|jgi:UDPglucose 6-dehydrogenase
MKSSPTRHIAVIGLGKLGSCYSAFYADAGFEVIGVDTNAKSVAALNKGLPPVVEPRLAAYITKNKARLSATTNIHDAVNSADISFVVVPTPSKKGGAFSLTYIEAVCKEIGAALREKKEYHLVSIVSTVLPGDSARVIIPTLEKASGKKCGIDFGFTYNPSLIAIGDVLHNLEKPDFLFLGANDTRSDETLRAFFAIRYPHITPERMTVESVEVAKIALNSYITTKITFANYLGQLCEQIPNADVRSVTDALGKDARIGAKYFRSGLGFGGPCFPRDNEAFAEAALRYNVDLPIARAVHHANNSMPVHIVKSFNHHLRKHHIQHVGVLGVSYKPRTTMTEGSQALAIALGLIKKKFKVTIFEPLGNSEARKVIPQAVFASSFKGLIHASEALFISNPDDYFKTLPAFTATAKKLKVIYDPWNMFTTSDFPPHVHYIVPGRPHTYARSTDTPTKNR